MWATRRLLFLSSLLVHHGGTAGYFCCTRNDFSKVLSTSVVSFVVTPSPPASAATTTPSQCKDIETCREIGERRDAEDLAMNPIIRLGDGLQYKVLSKGLGSEIVNEKSKIRIIYSISKASGVYMYSKGFGYNQIDVGDGKRVNDLGLDSLTVDMSDPSAKQIPDGIRRALIGMRRGERRRIECPPKLGFETSDWNPQPTDFRGRQQIKDYKLVLSGRGDNQPAFPAPTIWDVEIISIR